MNHNSISDIRQLLEESGIALKKRFGQNFLVDQNVRERIAALIRRELPPAAAPEATTELWEIGPGIGSLTELLLQIDVPVRLFEIDHGIIAVLRRLYGDDLMIEAGDFLTTGLAAFRRHGSPAMIVGNLPYSSASSMVARIVEEAMPVGKMVFLVQTEFAQRLCAEVGKKDYSALSVLVQNHYDTEIAFSVGGGAFYPRPEVGSALIVMREKADRLPPALTRTTSMVARTAFSQRRKALRNSLKAYRTELAAAGIDAGLRPERLSPADFVRLAREITPDRIPS
ncbi:MAG: 16S rRNA (adenine(1518)-N(6)/adenine(1519)-N(6))-dimethyltransferase RsmA [Spirochaeta sp.]|nr:16S rRNA (adenine(1518)-N(6)/adenine(1519)-N(6))-dimethyltransferase RsmA [Spirochaeta sp.]